MFLADERFALKANMMHPYPKSCSDRSEIMFNYRLSRARRGIENSFGILATQFRIFGRLIVAGVEEIIAITKMTCLSNMYGSFFHR